MNSKTKKGLTSSTPTVSRKVAPKKDHFGNGALGTSYVIQNAMEVQSSYPHFSTLQLVCEAIRLSGVSRKGASYPAIKKFVLANSRLTEGRALAALKKAVSKGLEDGLLKRAAASKNAVGCTGHFLLVKENAKSRKPKTLKREGTGYASDSEMTVKPKKKVAQKLNLSDTIIDEMRKTEKQTKTIKKEVANGKPLKQLGTKKSANPTKVAKSKSSSPLVTKINMEIENKVGNLVSETESASGPKSRSAKLKALKPNVASNSKDKPTSIKTADSKMKSKRSDSKLKVASTTPETVATIDTKSKRTIPKSRKVTGDQNSSQPSDLNQNCENSESVHSDKMNGVKTRPKGAISKVKGAKKVSKNQLQPKGKEKSTIPEIIARRRQFSSKLKQPVNVLRKDLSDTELDSRRESLMQFKPYSSDTEL